MQTRQEVDVLITILRIIKQEFCMKFEEFSPERREPFKDGNNRGGYPDCLFSL